MSTRRIVWASTIAIAGGWALLSLLVIAGLILLPATSWLSLEQNSRVTLISTALGHFGLSLILLGSAVFAFRQPLGRAFYPHWGWLAGNAALTLGALTVGALGGSTLQSSLLFAPLHLLAITGPAIGVLCLLVWATGRESASTRREATLNLAGGALSTFLALPVEAFGLFASALLVAGLAYLTPGGGAEVARLWAQLQRWSELPAGMVNVEDVLALAASPIVLSTLALTIAVITPLVEEIGKTLTVVILGFRYRPGPLRAFLWGATCGLGFAIVEGIGNGALGIGDSMQWLGGIGSRIFATFMHALTSGLIGLGWGLFWQKRRWVLPLAYLCAFLFHGLWNLSVVVMLGGALPAASGAMSVGAGVAVFTGLGALGLLALLAPTLLLGLPLILRALLPAPPAAPLPPVPEAIPVEPVELPALADA